MAGQAEERKRLRAALAALGVERLVLVVHDASFPAGPDEDVGRGSPYSRAAARLYELASACGFDGVQLGPQGKTSPSNPSPYDGSLMAKSPLSIALAELVDGPELGGLLPAAALARATARRPAEAARRAQHGLAWAETERALRAAYRRFSRAPAAFPALEEARDAFALRHADWLEADGVYEALVRLYGTDDHRRWERRRERGGSGAGAGAGTGAGAGAGAAPDLDRRLYDPARSQRQRAEARRRELLAGHADLVAYNTFCQALLDVEHRRARERLAALGLRLYGDLQIGIGHRDVWRYGGLLLGGYLMGAPPSRTNPEGQAWGYPVLDPDLYHAGGARAERAGPALRFFADRIERLLDDFDGLRIDHPHGLVCPWVYEAGAPRPLEAVRAGARLFSSPDLQDHPRLARFAIARPRDLAPRAEGRPRYADDWVRRLDEAQVARYAVLMDALMRLVRARGRGRSDVCTEVLSTCPYPLARVLERHGLGRVRVVQKADPSDEHDPYRSARAAPEDWITLGTHDTPPIWRVLRGRMGGPAAAAWASYLARRLAPRPNAREALGTRLVSDGRALVEALFADLFVGPARHVSVFFADFLGLRDTYNVPGTVSDLNWSLRVPPDFESVYARRRARGEALDVARALALALRARAAGASGDLHDLAAALEVRRAREA